MLQSFQYVKRDRYETDKDMQDPNEKKRPETVVDFVHSVAQQDV